MVEISDKNKYKLTNKKNRANTTKYPAHRVTMRLNINAFTHVSKFLYNHDQKIRKNTVINEQITNDLRDDNK